jgi:hypothetical protein
MMSNRFLSEKDLTYQFVFDTKKFEPISQDTYDENEILKSITSNDVEQLFACALQFSIIGTGNRSYGKIQISGADYNILELMKKNNVKYGNLLNSKLGPGDLTLRRLARFFRYQISKYIKQANYPSFLYSKYASVGLPEFIFPCAEYLVVSGQENGLLLAYQELDKLINTQFYSRTKLILRARQISCRLEI